MLPTDQSLLVAYVKGQDDAFRAVLERHAGLVYGVALRLTGDAEAAREVVQDVFLVLARKARRLTDHPSVAAWLHRTTRHVARDAVRAKQRHERKVARFAHSIGGDAASPSSSPHLELLDGAIAKLPAQEREAILLRFFEDREYGCIARELNLSEAAVRKRVSRGLRRLQSLIGSQAACGALLASLVVAPPKGLVAAVMPSIPASASNGVPWTLLFLMTHNHLLKAVGALIILGLLSFGIYQSSQREHYQNLYESSRTGDAPRGTSLDNDAQERTRLESEVAQLKQRLANAERNVLDANAKYEALAASTKGLEDELVLSYGRIDDVGKQYGTLIAEAMALKQLEDQGEVTPDDDRWKAFLNLATSITGLSQEIVGFEDNLDKGPPFFSAVYASVFDLNDAERARVQAVFESHFAVAAERQLTLSNIPKEDRESIDDFMEARRAYFDQVRSDLRAALPERAFATFDENVERRGYGFRNLKLRGVPLAFSLGGDQSP